MTSGDGIDLSFNRTVGLEVTSLSTDNTKAILEAVFSFLRSERTTADAIHVHHIGDRSRRHLGRGRGWSMVDIVSGSRGRRAVRGSFLTVFGDASVKSSGKANKRVQTGGWLMVKKQVLDFGREARLELVEQGRFIPIQVSLELEKPRDIDGDRPIGLTKLSDLGGSSRGRVDWSKGSFKKILKATPVREDFRVLVGLFNVGVEPSGSNTSQIGSSSSYFQRSRDVTRGVQHKKKFELVYESTEVLSFTRELGGRGNLGFLSFRVRRRVGSSRSRNRDRSRSTEAFVLALECHDSRENGR